MANFARLFSVTRSIGSQIVKHSARNPVVPKNVPILSTQVIRCISASKKDQSSPDDIPVLDNHIPTPPSHIMKQPRTPIKDWQSHGFDDEDEVEDLNEFHSTMFFTVSLLSVGIIFYWMYFPDYLQKEWIQREAYLLIRERENAGVPYIDPNYVDPATIQLPSEEELEGVEIII